MNILKFSKVFNETNFAGDIRSDDSRSFVEVDGSRSLESRAFVGGRFVRPRLYRDKAFGGRRDAYPYLIFKLGLLPIISNSEKGKLGSLKGTRLPFLF